MKCPVCDNVNTSMVCPNCGFDSSRDYGKNPTFSPVGRVITASALRKQWQEKQQPVVQPSVQPELSIPHRKKSKLLPLLIAAGFVLTLCLGVWIGSGLGGEKPAEPEESVQLQVPLETTKQTIPLETTIPCETIVPSEPSRSNVLCSDGLTKAYTYNGDFCSSDVAYKASVFGSIYRREQIQSITFLDTLEDIPADAWDVSKDGNGCVMAWVMPDADLYDLYIGAEGGVCADKSCLGLFMGYKNAVSITFADAFNTAETISMMDMFRFCESLTKIDLSSLDTSEVQNMRGMFNGCISLKELNLGRFDTSNVFDMSSMFEECRSLTELNLDIFDTSKVSNMSSMFKECRSLTELNLSSFNTSNVGTSYGFDSMESMFEGCRSITVLNLNSFDTSNVRSMNSMFEECRSITELDLSNFDTSKMDSLYNFHRMFYNCRSLTKLNLSSGFVLSRHSLAQDIFYNCPAGADYQHLLN